MPFIEELGMQAASQASNNLVGGIMGLALGGINDRRQLKQQEKLQNLQISGNKQMMDYSMQKQLQMWKDTNYQAQVQELEKAGLNPALMYGMSGGGGVTTGSPSGNVQGATAPQGGGEILQMAAMGIQLKGQEAEIKLKEAQARNLNVDSDQKETLGKEQTIATIEQIRQNTKSLVAQQALTNIEVELKKLEKQFNESTLKNRESLVNLSLSKLLEEVKIIENDRKISDATKQDTIKAIKARAIGALLQNDATKAGIAVDQAQLKKIAADITNATRGLNLQESGQAIEKTFKEELIKLGYTQATIGAVSNIVSKFIP